MVFWKLWETKKHYIHSVESPGFIYAPCLPINFIGGRIWYSLLADSHWIFLGNISWHNDLNNLRHFENDEESWEDLAWDSVVKSIAIDSWRSGNNYISKIWWNPKLQVLELIVYACPPFDFRNLQVFVMDVQPQATQCLPGWTMAWVQEMSTNNHLYVHRYM